MKFLLALTLATAAVAQTNKQAVSTESIIPPPIAIYQAEALDQKQKQHKQKPVNQGFNPLVDPIFQNGHPMIGKQEKYEMSQLNNGQNSQKMNQNNDDPFITPPRPYPMPPPPGQNQFNPYEIPHPGPGPHQGRFPSREDFNPHQNKHQKNQKFDKGKQHKGKKQWKNKHQNQLRLGDQQRQDPSALPYPLDYEAWERHIKANHMKGGKYHKKMHFAFVFVAIIFTLFGLCLGKCIRKCKKNKKRRVRDLMMRQKTSTQIQQQIQEQQTKLQQLKNQFRTKKADEQRVIEFRRQEETAFRNQEVEMRQPYYQPQRPQYPVQPHAYYYNPRTHIPVGRPLNESTNSSFATEYPNI